MRKELLILAGISLLLNPMGDAKAQGDNTTYNWKFEEANKRTDEKFYDQAAELWSELVESNPENSNLNWKLGHAYFHSVKNRDKALSFLEKAAERRNNEYSIANISDYDPYDPRELNAPPEVDYYLARSYHLNYELDKAEIYYEKFMDQRDVRHDLYSAARRGVSQVGNARELMSAPKDYPVQNLGSTINSKFPDFSPVISLDGNSLFFTSRRVRPDSTNEGVIDDLTGFPYEDVYVSYKDRDGNWQEPELLNINTPGHLASINVSADGQRLFMYQDDGGDGNIYQSRLIGETWSEPEKLGPNINTKSWETHAALSADGNTMYFVSDKEEGSLGGRDIYRVVKLPDGTWSKAQGLGGVINTPYDEEAPFIHPDGRRLFFASKGHNSMGGFDIFYSELQENGSWSVPTNLGYPLNTVDDDVFFVTTADGRRGYFSSDKDGGSGEKDIYTVELPVDMESEGLTVLKGFIIPPAGQPLPPNTILYVTDRETGEVQSYRPRSRDGVYVVILPPCKEYNLDYRVNEETVHTEDIYVECETAYQEINKEIYLNPVTLTDPAQVKDLPYPPDAAAQGREVPPAVVQTPSIPEGEQALQPISGTSTGTQQPGGGVVVDVPSGSGTTGESGTGTESTGGTQPGSGTQPSAGGDPGSGQPGSGQSGTQPATAVAGAGATKSVTAITPSDVSSSKGTKPVIPANVKFDAEYTKFYGYNMKDIDLQEKQWKVFIDKLGKIIESNGKANLIIEASASKVPTTTFGTNENLSKQRMEDARRRLIESLNAAGIDANKVVISAINHSVLGPNYRGDYTNTQKYGDYQYVKLRAN